MNRVTIEEIGKLAQVFGLDPQESPHAATLPPLTNGGITQGTE